MIHNNSVDVWPSPELDDLMNDVVSKIPAQWRAVGIQLGVPSCTLDSIQHQNAGKPQACYESFETVLSTWKQNQYKPYTWTTIIDALETPSVGQVALAEVLRAKCMERKKRSVGTDANAMRSRVQGIRGGFRGEGGGGGGGGNPAYAPLANKDKPPAYVDECNYIMQ